MLASVPARRRALLPVLALGTALVATTVVVAVALRWDGAAKVLGAPELGTAADTTAPTIGGPAAANPPERTHAAMASSPEGVILTGGQGTGGIRTDTWMMRTPQAPVWEPRSEPTTAPPRSAASLSFADSIGAFLLFGGTSNPASSACPPACVSQVPTDDLWRYDPSDDRWSAVSALGPERRLGHAAAYDPQADRLIVFGGIGSSGRPGVRAGRLLGDTWLFDPTAGTWEQVETPQAPEPRVWHRMVYHPGQGVVFLWGGRTAQRDGDPAVWVFDVAARTWDPLPVNGPDPPPRWLHTMTLGPDGILVVVGGEWFQRRPMTGGSATVLGATEEVWGWNPHTGEWARLADFPVPISRHAAAATGDGHSRVVVFHGDHTSVYGTGEGWIDVSPETAETDH